MEDLPVDSGDQIIYSVIAGIKRFISSRYEKKREGEGSAPLLLRNSINNDSTGHRKWSRLLFIHGCGRKMDLFIFNGDAITRLKNQSIEGGAVSVGPEMKFIEIN